MEQVITNTKILKIDQSILTHASTFNHALFHGLVTSMREHVKERNCDVEIYTEEFDGKNITGEETVHLFDTLEMLDTWLKTIYPNNVNYI